PPRVRPHRSPHPPPPRRRALRPRPRRPPRPGRPRPSRRAPTGARARATAGTAGTATATETAAGTTTTTTAPTAAGADAARPSGRPSGPPLRPAPGSGVVAPYRTPRPDGLAVGRVPAAPALGELRDQQQPPAALVPRLGPAQVRRRVTGVGDLADQGGRVVDQPQPDGRRPVPDGVGDQFAHHQLGGERRLGQRPGGELLQGLLPDR